MKRTMQVIIGAIILLVLIFGSAMIRLYTDWLWFGEVGYRAVYWTRLTDKALLGLIAGLAFFAIVYVNLWIARRFTPPVLGQYDARTIRTQFGDIARKGFGWLIFGCTLVISVFVAMEATTHWINYAMFTHPTPFGSVDPIFHRDIGFYIFKLNFLQYIYGWLMFTLVVAMIATALVSYAERAIEFLAGRPTFAPHVKAHLSLLFAAILLVKAWGYTLDAYNLLYSESGVVFGAGYTDIHARLVALQILAVVAVIAGILSLINIKRRGVALPVTALIVLVGASIIVGGIYPAIVQSFVVTPNAIARESKYIAYDIQSTRKAFNLDVIQEEPFPRISNLTASDINDNRATINSIRVWDYRPLAQTYTQLQALGPYYDIANVDVDRYMVNGEERQVMLAARELSLSDTQSGAGTWVNRHFQYTHGYGMVMSPVNRATPEGLPDFFVSDMPPTSTVGIDVTQPQIYFGQETSDFVIVDSTVKEYDYPAGNQPVYTSYSGTGGISISNYLRRIAFAWRFGDLQLMLQNPITSDSRILFHRTIQERVQTIFPFLTYDTDPYLVVSEGKQYWMLDAYSVSNKYPYSKPLEDSDVNYMRNAAKVVIDAYNGDVHYYMADVNDPIVKTYAKIFPGVFRPMSSMPVGLRSHVRYPETLFKVQANVLLTYHMKSPQTFYNKGDLWAIPNEIVQTSGNQTPIEPYYVVMTLPGETQEEFLMMLPFTPINKDNMIAWMAARSDPKDYGKIVLYQFPKDQLIYGPAQIESRIRQDSAISPQLSLWNTEGSRVNWGNMLVIPINHSIMYVKPLYLESESAKIPELKRVIVSYGNQLAMEPTLDAAIARIFGGEVSLPQAAAGLAPSTTKGIPATPQTRKLIDQAVAEFERAKELQQKGDWAGYGEQINKLEQTLRQLRGSGG